MGRVRFAGCLLAIALAFGCEDSSPTAPSTANVAGIWSGTLCAPDRYVSCMVRVTLEQDGTSLTGTWSGAAGPRGPVTGTVSGQRVNLVLGRQVAMLTLKRDTLSGRYGNSNASLTR